jgi:hypothetical protein
LFYTFLPAILHDSAGVSTKRLPIYLLIAGVTSFIGNALAGARLDKGTSPKAMLGFALAAVAAIIAVFPYGAFNAVAAGVVILFYGFAVAHVQLPLQYQLMRIVPQHTTIVVSLLNSALYLGTAAGAAIGGGARGRLHDVPHLDGRRRGGSGPDHQRRHQTGRGTAARPGRYAGRGRPAAGSCGGVGGRHVLTRRHARDQPRAAPLPHAAPHCPVRGGTTSHRHCPACSGPVPHAAARPPSARRHGEPLALTTSVRTRSRCACRVRLPPRTPTHASTTVRDP